MSNFDKNPTYMSLQDSSYICHISLDMIYLKILKMFKSCFSRSGVVLHVSQAYI